jgi:hypothetical protein
MATFEWPRTLVNPAFAFATASRSGTFGIRHA